MQPKLKRLILLLMTRRDAERFRTLLACLLYYTGIAWLISRRTRRGGYIVMYHSVGGEGVYWDNVISKESFARQVKWLARHRTIVPVRDFVDRINGNAPVPDDWIALTFDDGYLDNLSNALPVLESMNAAASFYVTWNVLSGQQEFFYDRIHASVSRTRKGSIRVMLSDGPFEGPTITNRQKLDCIQEIVLRIRNLDEEERARCVRSVEEACLDSESKMPQSYLDENALMDLSGSSLAEIGSHTLSHPDLAECSSLSLDRELRESRENLSRTIGDDIDGLAYPFGKKCNYSDEVVRRCVDTGYRFALTTTYGSVQEDSDPFQLPRVGARDSLARLKVNLMGIGI